MATLDAGTSNHEKAPVEFEPFVDADKTDSTPSAAKSSTLTSRTIADYFLGFISTATNQQILVILGGLSLLVIVILGRFGFLLVGLVAGFLLRESWDTVDHDAGERKLNNGFQRKKRETGIEVANRLLGFSSRLSTDDKLANDLVATDQAKATGDGKLDFAHFPPATAGALQGLTEAIIDNYVKWWYSPILPSEETFPLSCRILLSNFLISASTHLTRKRPADTFLQFVTNSSSMIIVFLNELSTAFRSTNLDSLSPQEIIKEYLDENPDCSLANVLDTEQQKKKLNMVADDIIAAFLDSKAYNCQVVRDFLRESFATLVLESVITKSSQPEFINDWVIYLLQEGEPEILNAIDAGLEHTEKHDHLQKPPVLAGQQASLETENRLTSLPFQGDKPDMLTIKGPPGLAAADLKDAYRLSTTAKLDMTNAGTDKIADGIAVAYSGANCHPSDSAKIDSGYVASVGASTTSCANEIVPSAAFDLEVDPENLRSMDSSRPPSSSSHLMGFPEETGSSILHGASVSIYDCSDIGDKAPLRSKPLSEYSLQIEPVSSRQPGWIIFRLYSDFETLHEGLSAISRINNIHTFSNKHVVLPTWKGHTRRALAQELENYVQDALSHQLLADSARVKRFLEKDRGTSFDSPVSSKAGFSFPRSAAFENMGKGMLEVLSNAPKGVAGGGKAVLEGVTGVFGGVTAKKTLTAVKNRDPEFPHMLPRSSGSLHHAYFRQSEDRSSIASSSTLNLTDEPSQPATSVSVVGERILNDSNHSDDSLRQPTWDRSREVLSTTKPSDTASQTLIRPESPPNSIFALPTSSSPLPTSSSPEDPMHTDMFGDMSSDVPMLVSPEAINDLKPIITMQTTGSQDTGMRSRSSTTTEKKSHNLPLKEDETRVAVELIFAVINELYTLSSAWNFRKTLLNAAKSYILRPGNPSLEGIRALIQDSMIDAQTSDSAIAAHLIKLRENSLPTEEELRAWPSPPNEDEKARMKADARKLFMQRGLPQALMSVMGAGASNEALGRIFDCLQIEEIARGFMFALVLQALRVFMV